MSNSFQGYIPYGELEKYFSDAIKSNFIMYIQYDNTNKGFDYYIYDNTRNYFYFVGSKVENVEAELKKYGIVISQDILMNWELKVIHSCTDFLKDIELN